LEPNIWTCQFLLFAYLWIDRQLHGRHAGQRTKQTEGCWLLHHPRLHKDINRNTDEYEDGGTGLG